MCVGSRSPSVPAPLPPPPPPPDPPKRVDVETRAAREDERNRVRQLAGVASLNKTKGLLAGQEPNTNKKTLGA